MRGVDPATNELPAGQVLDQSTASPVVAPDGSVLFGTYARYNYARGHLFHFSAAGQFLNAYGFGWDITPAVFEHDGTWSALVKDNGYPLGSYCDGAPVCGAQSPHYNLTSLGPDMQPAWTYANSNTQSCEREDDGTLQCQPGEPGGFEWCVNMVAVDAEGTAYANSEDGNVYAIDKNGKPAGQLFLRAAFGAAYTPLAIGSNGLVYAQNDGILFIAGRRPARASF
jgi:outer membrane protein assembly factor BamB